MSDHSNRIKLEDQWKAVLGNEFSKPYMQKLRKFLLAEKSSGKQIFPPGDEILQAFNLTPFANVKAVIIGQDPYHGPGQAHGLCFSVKPDVRVPPSLVNIYKELEDDLQIPPPSHGYLKAWAERGVLLLNAVLTVERNKPASHQNQGWEEFTDQAIKELNDRREHLVFILWGAYAQQKGRVIDREKHLVIESSHPSPYSANRGFLGSKPFSKTNHYLQSKGMVPIDWRL
ncbi:MAG: uracil-DNA glycosylase [Deltaproteobacteria bacterium]|nr:uracil-DNA glycosylase [Deltaproteobacteria bacterium]